jgi:hypothetical protein
MQIGGEPKQSARLFMTQGDAEETKAAARPVAPSSRLVMKSKLVVEGLLLESPHSG